MSAFSGRTVDDELEVGRLLDGEIRRSRPLEDLFDVCGQPLEMCGHVRPVRGEPSGVDATPDPVHRRKTVCERKLRDTAPVGQITVFVSIKSALGRRAVTVANTASRSLSPRASNAVTSGIPSARAARRASPRY